MRLLLLIIVFGVLGWVTGSWLGSSIVSAHDPNGPVPVTPCRVGTTAWSDREEVARLAECGCAEVPATVLTATELRRALAGKEKP